MEGADTEINPPVAVNEEICNANITFNRALPGLHQYLGSDLAVVGGRSYLEPGEDVRLFAFYRSNIILVPGQTVPLTSLTAAESVVLKQISSLRQSIIFLPGCFERGSSLDNFVGCVGTTADLVSIHIPDPQEHKTIRAIFTGRQRIRITKATRHSGFPLFCYGIVLPEASLDCDIATHALGCGLVPHSWSRFGLDPPLTHFKRASREDNLLRSSSYSSQIRRKPYQRASAAHSERKSVFPLLGNHLAMFNSRLSTWRLQSIPVGSGNLSSPPNSPYDHFVADGEEMYFDATSEPHIIRPSSGASEGSRIGYFEQDDDEVVDARTEATVDERLSPQAAEKVKSPEEEERSAASSDGGTEELELIVDRAVDRDGRPFRYKIRQRLYPRILARRDVLATVADSLTAFPPWVYRQYDIHYLVTTIQAELLCWNDTWNVDNWTSELAIPFSYWLVQNLPISSSLKAKLLEVDHVVQRLRAVLSVIRQYSSCVCGACGVAITSNKYIICLAQEGCLQTYINPAGNIFDILTVSQVERGSCHVFDPPSSAYSWFPGYNWSCTKCSNCSNLLGWRFTTDDVKLQPKQFWGICRDAIEPGFINNTDWLPVI